MVREPVVREANCSTDTTALVADLSVCGVWVPQFEALFDIRIIDTDAQSYCTRPPITILSNAEMEKKKKYQQPCHELSTPLCISVDGMMGKETTVFLKRIAEQLSMKWDYSYI